MPGRLAATQPVFPQELSTDPLSLQQSADGGAHSQGQGCGQAPASLGQKALKPLQLKKRGTSWELFLSRRNASAASVASVTSAGGWPHNCLAVPCQ